MTRLLELKDFFIYSLKHPKVRLAATAALSLAALNLALVAFYWVPSAWRHHQAASAIESLRRSRLEAEQAGDLFRRYQDLLKRAGVLEAKWKTPASQSSLVGALDRLAAKNGLKVLSQDFNAGTSKKGGTVLEENLSVVGAYPSLRHFLADLEGLKTLTVVEEARLERAEEEGGRVRAILKLSTFSRSSGHGPQP